MIAMLLTAALATSSALPSMSAAPAQALVSQLTSRHLDAIAAPDPAQPGRFVAALFVPGSELLVVSATSPSTDAIARQIAMRDYHDVYLDLQGTPTPAGKFFVEDNGADGIHDAHDGIVDVIFENGTDQTMFDRSVNPSLTGAAYAKALASADQRYAHALMVLADALRAQISS